MHMRHFQEALSERPFGCTIKTSQRDSKPPPGYSPSDICNIASVTDTGWGFSRRHTDVWEG